MIKEDYKVIIAGGRNFSDKNLLTESCNAILKPLVKDHAITIISGNAPGADRTGERYAQERGFKIKRMPADWKKYGKAAGPIRNREMAEQADALIAFWDGSSRGTANMIESARHRNLIVNVINYPVC